MRKRSLSYIFGSKIEKKMHHIKHRSKFMKAIENPSEFTNIKWSFWRFSQEWLHFIFCSLSCYRKYLWPIFDLLYSNYSHLSLSTHPPRPFLTSKTPLFGNRQLPLTMAASSSSQLHLCLSFWDLPFLKYPLVRPRPHIFSLTILIMFRVTDKYNDDKSGTMQNGMKSRRRRDRIGLKILQILPSLSPVINIHLQYIKEKNRKIIKTTFHDHW